MVGRKSQVLLDTLDLQILELLSTQELPLGVLEITKRLGLTHPNAKTHLQKLRQANLIITLHERTTNKINITTANNPFTLEMAQERYDNHDISEKKFREAVREGEKIDILIEQLQQLKSVDNQKVHLKSFSSELKTQNPKE